VETKIREYVQQLFADAPQTRAVADLREEMIENLIQKYRELRQEGKSEEMAYHLTILSIGDTTELMESLRTEAQEAREDLDAPGEPSANPTPAVAAAPIHFDMPKEETVNSSPLKKDHTVAKVLGFGCLGIFLLIVLLTVGLFLAFLPLRAEIRSHNGDSVIHEGIEAIEESSELIEDEAKDLAHRIEDWAKELEDRFSSTSAGWTVVYEENTVDAASVNTLIVDWTAGSVVLETYEGDQILFSETARGNLDDDERLQYRVENGRLEIRYCESKRWFFWSDWNFPTKELTVRIPSSWVEGDMQINTVSASCSTTHLAVPSFIVNTVSGDVYLTDCAVDTLSVNTVSGECRVENSVCDTMKFNSTSGKLDFEGELYDLSTNTVSGDVKLESRLCPATLEADSTSGRVTLLLPADSGFTLEYDSISGDVSNEFNAQIQGGKYIVGSGEADFNVDTTSGDVILQIRD